MSALLLDPGLPSPLVLGGSQSELALGPGDSKKSSQESGDPSSAHLLEEELYPMENLSLVAPGVYRSAFPIRRNFPFLKKLGLKAILTLILEEYPEQNMKFLQDNGIRLFQFGVAGNKEPFVDIPEDKVPRYVYTLA